MSLILGRFGQVQRIYSDKELDGGKLNATKIAIAKKIRNYTDEQVMNNFKALEELPCDIKAQSSLAGLKVVDRATFAERLDTKSNKGVNFYDVFQDRKNRLNPSRKRLLKFQSINTPNANEETNWYRLFGLYFNSISAFKPSIAKYLYCKFNAKNILDFSAGWGGRLVGAMSLPGTNYIGIDTNTDLKAGYKYLIDTLDVNDRVKMIWKDSSKVDYSKLKYDFVFTSPPYFTLENYEHMPEYKTVDDFNNNFWFPVLKKVINGLDSGGKLALNIPKPMYEDTIKLIGKASTLIPLLKRPRRKGVNAYKEKYEEFIYVWNKDDLK